MDILVVYDIADKRRLRRVAKTVQSFGYRVQKSVFECSLRDSQIKELIGKVKNEMLMNEDALRVYPLLSGSREKQTIVGKGEYLKFEEMLLV